MEHRSIQAQIGRTAITLGPSWILVGPLGLWLIATLYLPVMAPFLAGAERWVMAIILTLLAAASIGGHLLGHLWAAGATRSEIPTRTPLCLFGDAAQVWPAASTAPREALVAIAGPLANLLVAGMAYLIWNLQWHPHLNTALLFLALFNLALAVVNASPGFPLDGGRLTRAIIWGLLNRPRLGTQGGRGLGYVIALVLAIWGIVLLAGRARFSLETGAATILIAGFLFTALHTHRVWEWDRPEPFSARAIGWRIIRGLAAALLILGLLGVTLSLAPMVNGISAPGLAVSVEPMILVPPDHRYPSAGSFILTTVIVQTPILAGQWAYAHLDPAVELVPPEQVVPPGTTPQEVMQRSFQMLEESRTIAKVVALRLAGYEVEITGQGVRVLSVLPESPSHGRLLPGDRIIALNGEPVGTVNELRARLPPQDPNQTITLLAERAGRQVQVTALLMSPSAPEDPPRIGITVETVGLDVRLPFAVEIEPQKIAGGPSAGLMFTLTIYDLITPGDLTGGYRIAGTGTIDLDGTVGPIGGVAQKVAAAEAAGAAYFLVPPVNYQTARRVARRIQVVEVATAQEAIDFLRSLSDS